MSLLLKYELDTPPGEDSLGNGLDMTSIGVTPVSDPLGIFGDVAFFDGSSYLNLGTLDVPSEILGNSPRTFSFWIIPDSNNSNGNILGYGTNALHGLFRVVWVVPDRVVMIAFSDRFFIGTVAIPVDSWTHVAVTYDSSGNLRTYINGVLDLDILYTEINTNSGTLSLGRFPLNSNLPEYIGYMMDFRAYDDALDLAAVSVLISDGPRDLYKIVFEADVYTHMADVTWNSIIGASLYTVTLAEGEGDEVTILNDSTELAVTTKDLSPETSYELRLYTDSDTSSPVTSLSITTPVLGPSSGIDISQRLGNDFTGLVNFDPSEIQEYLNDIFETGDVVVLEDTTSYVFVKDSEDIAFTPSTDIRGILTPFQSDRGGSQAITVSSDIISYDETSNEVSINSTILSPGESAVLNGYKVTMKEL